MSSECGVGPGCYSFEGTAVVRNGIIQLGNLQSTSCIHVDSTDMLFRKAYVFRWPLRVPGMFYRLLLKLLRRSLRLGDKLKRCYSRHLLMTIGHNCTFVTVRINSFLYSVPTPNTNYSCDSVILSCSCILEINDNNNVDRSVQANTVFTDFCRADVELDVDQRVQSAPRTVAADEQWNSVGAMNVCQSVNRLIAAAAEASLGSLAVALPSVDVSFQLWLLSIHVLRTTCYSYIAISSYNHYTTVNAATCVRSYLSAPSDSAVA